MKLLLEILLESIGSVCFFMGCLLRQLTAFVQNVSYLKSHYKCLEKIAFSLHEVNKNIIVITVIF